MSISSRAPLDSGRKLSTSSSAKIAATKRPRKTARFDENNIRLTFHPDDKEYGHDIVDEPKTPFAREVEPVDAEVLNEKLMAYKQNKSARSSESSSSTTTRESFYDKRKKFQASEYLIAKQMADKQKLLPNDELTGDGSSVIALKNGDGSGDTDEDVESEKQKAVVIDD